MRSLSGLNLIRFVCSRSNLIVWTEMKLEMFEILLSWRNINICMQ